MKCYRRYKQRKELDYLASYSHYDSEFKTYFVPFTRDRASRRLFLSYLGRKSLAEAKSKFLIRHPWR